MVGVSDISIYQVTMGVVVSDGTLLGHSREYDYYFDHQCSALGSGREYDYFDNNNNNNHHRRYWRCWKHELEDPDP